MRQTTKFYLTSFLKNQTYFTPILILFLQLNHLNYQEIFWIFTIASIFSFIIEIPTGIFADLYGKKKSIIISKFGIFMSYVLFGFSRNFWMFLLSQLLFELGNSFRTGTETAYVFDYLNQNRDVPSYTEVKGKQKFYARISEAGASAASGFIAKIFGYHWAFFAAAVPAFLNILIALSWEDIKETKQKITYHKTLVHAKQSVCELCRKKNLLIVTLNIMIFTATLAALQKFIQPYMTDANIPVQWFGVLYSLFLTLAAIAGRYSYMLEEKFGTKSTINFISLFAVLPVLILGFGHVSLIGVFLFFVVIIIENIRSPIVNNEFHDLVKSKQRATMGSILELTKSVGKVVVLPVAGYVADKFSIYTAVLLMGIILAINGIILRIKK